jgi:hypothetical protein
MEGINVFAVLVAAASSFANRSALLWLIDGGYHTAQFVLFGLIIGLWH